MPCKLCLQNRPLRGSHIIPEFFYAGAYDKKHRALELTRDTGRERLLQKGYREPMLCDQCEAHFSQFETYFKKQWYDAGLLPLRLDSPQHSVAGLDYKLTKLLHLSILWRASVASHPMFRSVKLRAHEDKIRAMLLKDDPGLPEQYHWAGQILVLDGEVVDGFIFEPTAYKHEGRHIYMFTYGGCAWFFVVSGEPVRAWLPLALTTAGSQVLLRQQITKDPIIADFLVDLAKYPKE